MRALFLSVLVLGAGLVLAETDFSHSVDGLVKEWAQADTAEKRKAAMAQSYSTLKRHVTAQSPEDVGAVVRVLGAIYAWDYDSLNDTLSLFRKRLNEPEFRRAFDDELARLPDDQRRKLSDGLVDLQSRPDCRYKGKQYVCVEPKESR